MTLFLRLFIKVFAFLCSISVFIFVLSFTISFISDQRNDEIFYESSGDLESSNKIAVINLNGPILNEPPNNLNIDLFQNINIIYVSEVKKTLEKIKDLNILGLVISINSPGGSVSASYNLYNLINNFSRDNSVKVFFHTKELLASGAYWVALSGEKIFANYGSLIGSIGVKGPDWIYFDKPISLSNGIFGNSIETKDGVKNFSNISGKSKDLFNIFRSPTEKEISDLQKITNNIYNDFVNIVSKGRSLENDVIVNEIGAMIYDSKTAKENFLIDNIHSLEFVINNLAKDLSIKNYKIIRINKNNQNFFNSILKYTSNFNKNTNFYEKIFYSEVCNNVKYGLSTIFFSSKIISNC